MTAPTPSVTFLQALKINCKRVLTYWAQIGVTLSAIGTGIGYLTLSLYTNAIGRPDLLSSALDSTAALVLWLALTALVVAAYLIVMAAPAVLYGLSVSMFNKTPNEQGKVALLLLAPICVGMTALIYFVYIEHSMVHDYSFGITLALIILTLAILLLSKDFRKSVKQNVEIGLATTLKKQIAYFVFFTLTGLTIIASVISAGAPISLILKAYVGKGAQEEMAWLVVVSLGALILALMPVVVFFLSQSDLFTRTVKTAATAIGIVTLIIVISPGGATMVVDSTASLMNVRTQTAAEYQIDDVYKEEDFDTKAWASAKTAEGHLRLRGFPLFSFGDILLLCPESTLKTALKDWPSQSVYCIVTKNSKATRMPVNLNPKPKA